MPSAGLVRRLQVTISFAAVTAELFIGNREGHLQAHFP
jgi:hypothetical protein